MINILLVDDHAVVREGLRNFFERTPDIRIGGEASCVGEGLDLVRTRREEWNMVLLDIALPGQSGVEGLRLIKAEMPTLPVLMFSGFTDDAYIVDCLRAGAAGYLVKDCAPDTIRSAVRAVAAGGKFVDPSVAHKLVDAMSALPPPHEQLTEKEFKVMLRISRGQPLTAIGVDMHLSVKTISFHRAKVLEKLGVTSNADITRYVIEHKLDNLTP